MTPTGFTDGLDLGCKIKKDVKNDSGAGKKWEKFSQTSVLYMFEKHYLKNDV